MNRQRNNSTRVQSRGVWQRISQRLDDLALREGRFANSEKIALMRRLIFAEVDALEKSGRIKIPR